MTVWIINLSCYGVTGDSCALTLHRWHLSSMSESEILGAGIWGHPVYLPVWTSAWGIAYFWPTPEIRIIPESHFGDFFFLMSSLIFPFALVLLIYSSTYTVLLPPWYWYPWNISQQFSVPIRPFLALFWILYNFPIPVFCIGMPQTAHEIFRCFWCQTNTKRLWTANSTMSFLLGMVGEDGCGVKRWNIVQYHGATVM